MHNLVYHSFVVNLEIRERESFYFFITVSAFPLILGLVWSVLQNKVIYMHKEYWSIVFFWYLCGSQE